MLCSLEVSHSTFGHPEPENLPRDTSTAMTLMNPFLIFVLHCHLNARLPTTERYRCVKWASAHCRPTDWTWTWGEGEAVVSVRWPGIGCWCASSFPGMQSWVTSSGGRGESAHTDTTVRGVPPLPHCAIGEWWRGPHWQADSQQAGTTRCSRG